MAVPKSDIYQMKVQNKDARNPLFIPVLVLCNTSDEDLHRNIRKNSALDLDWVSFKKPHDKVAVLVGGGPSVAECLPEIKTLVDNGATLFAMNGASQFMRSNGFNVEYQVMADAKPESVQLADPEAAHHFYASQMAPDAMQAVDRLTLWHLGIENMEDLFPAERRQRGGYALIGGGASVGNSSLCLAYVMGYRTLHCFGFDSSHRGVDSHAYPQPMNDCIPTVEVEWAGKTYTASVAMKAQAEKFQITSQLLKQEGCEIFVHGDGLLPAMYNTQPKDLTERDKYRIMWQFDGYRGFSPGEEIVGQFLDLVKPDGLIVDFGCGTGRAAITMANAGHEVFLIDFADNCRDEEAVNLPFLEWDLSRPLPVRSNYGYCTDVMEHIPTDDIDLVLSNIMEASKEVFFQISTVNDVFGDVIGQRLHCSVKPHEWWADKFQSLGFGLDWQERKDTASCFLVNRTPSEGKTNGT